MNAVPSRKCNTCERDLPLSAYQARTAMCRECRSSKDRGRVRHPLRRGRIFVQTRRTGQPKRPAPSRILDWKNHYIPVPESGCWLWLGRVVRTKYGKIWIDGTERMAHRVFYELHRGPIPDGIFVCHKCDTPLCVNPDHLFLGTPKENVADMIRKGRHRPWGKKPIDQRSSP